MKHVRDVEQIAAAERGGKRAEPLRWRGFTRADGNREEYDKKVRRGGDETSSNPLLGRLDLDALASVPLQPV